MLKKFVENRMLRIAISISMIITAGYEVIHEFDEIGAHHGILIYASMELLKAISESYEAAKIATE
ncbi:MAG: hypothetical protein EBT20_00680 [Alphaproteobacteria bacterium]|nr:hypothetical protein [Alphaproteobacteria bacterium]